MAFSERTWKTIELWRFSSERHRNVAHISFLLMENHLYFLESWWQIKLIPSILVWTYKESMPGYLRTGLNQSNLVLYTSHPKAVGETTDRKSKAKTHLRIIYQNILISWTTIQYVTEKSQRDLRQVWLRFSSMWVLFETISAA